MDADKIPTRVQSGKQDGCFKNAYGYAQSMISTISSGSAGKNDDGTSFDILAHKVVGTTTSIMLLVDKGLLKIDDPVGKYIPDFNDPDKSKITIRHLLTHTAGLYEWYPLYYRCRNKEETYKLIGELPLKFPVGAQRHYSDLGFVVLGEIVEHLSGLSLREFMEKNIFIPLGMDHTAYNPLQTKKLPALRLLPMATPMKKNGVRFHTQVQHQKLILPHGMVGAITHSAVSGCWCMAC